MRLQILDSRVLCLFLTTTFILGSTGFARENRAGLMVEPSVSFEVSEASVNYPSPLSDSTGKADGLGLGARIGFHLDESFFLAIDGRYSMPQFNDSSIGYDARSIATQWGPLLGMQVPNFGLRLWGTLVLGGDLNPEKSGSFDLAFRKASGNRLGVGFRLSEVSLNLEYQQIKYNEVVLEQIGPFSSNTVFNSVKLENKSWILSVSFPMEL